MKIFENIDLPFGAIIDNDLIWCQILNRVSSDKKKPALFLDRDGVIVEEVNYLSKPENVCVINEIVNLIKRLRTAQLRLNYGKF